MSDRDTFGPRLRAERERRGISIETIASVTKVGGDLWDGLERNDFSRWPSGIFARAFVRDYARAIGLDSTKWWTSSAVCSHSAIAASAG